MPSYAATYLTPEDKRCIVSVLPLASTHIFSMARGQIYHAPFGSTVSTDWKPLDLRGAIIFGRDSRKTDDSSSSSSSSQSELDDTFDDDDLWFRLVELEGKKGSRVVWRQPVSATSSDYAMILPFFHVFSGNSRMFGFRFDDDGEAARFHETVMIRTKQRLLIKSNAPSRTWSKSGQRRSATLPVGGLPFPTLKIANPDAASFQHRAHLGLDDKGEILIEGEVDKKWSILFNGAPGKNSNKGNSKTASFMGSKKLMSCLRD